MESAGACVGTGKKKIALQLLEKGKSQVIKVDHETMLNRVMTALRARSLPIFSEIDCGEERVKVSIKLDLTFDEQENIVVLEGGPFRTKAAAEKEAVMLAFRHLDENCHIKVVDYSRRVSRSFGGYKTYESVNESLDSVRQMLDAFVTVLGKCSELEREFEGEAMNQKQGDGLTDDAQVFVEISRFLASVVKRFSIKAEEASKIISYLEMERAKHHEKAKAKAKCIAEKCYIKTAVLLDKELLDYVLSCFGFETAKYINGPGGDGMVEAVVMSNIPYIDGLKYCGNLRIKGKGENSTVSEESAAFEALKLIEEYCNVKIIDLNHSDRVKAEKVQIMLAQMLGQIIKVGETIKDMWEEMVKTIEEHGEHFAYELSSLIAGGKGENCIAAYQMCKEGLSRLEQDTSKLGYKICWVLSDSMEKIACELSVIKIRLGIM